MKLARYIPKPWPTSWRDGLMLSIGAVLALTTLCGTVFVRHATTTPLAPQTAGVSSPWIPPTVRHWDPLIGEMAKKYHIDPTAIAILMTMESGGYAQAKSEAGAVGLMQITPPTAGDIAKKYLKQPVTSYDLLDPRTSVEFGTAYMAYLRDEFGDRSQGPSWSYTMELVAAAYNGGPGAGGKLYHGEGMTDTQTVVYSRDALNMWRERKATDSPTFDRWKERGGSTLLDLAKAAQ